VVKVSTVVVIEWPGEPGSGFEFVSKIVGVLKEYIGPSEQGMKESCESGISAGYPVIDLKATLVDGSYHDVDRKWLSKLLAQWLSRRSDEGSTCSVRAYDES